MTITKAVATSIQAVSPLSMVGAPLMRWQANRWGAADHVNRSPCMVLDPPLAPMEALLAAELPNVDGWQYESKWDGFRCVASRDGGAVELTSKSGKPLGRYFPEVVALLESLNERRFVLDGE